MPKAPDYHRDGRALLKRERNELFDIAKASAVPLQRFEWSDDNTLVFRLNREIPGPAVNRQDPWFQVMYERWGDISRDDHIFFYQSSPARSLGSNKTLWAFVLSGFREWLKWVQEEYEREQRVAAEFEKEIQLRDLWTEAVGTLPTVSGGVTAEANSSFSNEERTRIGQALDKIIEAVEQEVGDLPPENVRELRVTFAFQKEAATRLGRIDWLNGFVGAIIGQVVTWAVAPEVRDAVLSIALTNWHWVSQFVRALPPFRG